MAIGASEAETFWTGFLRGITRRAPSANSALLPGSYVFGPYFVSRVAADPVHGQAVWGYAIAAASVVVALTAPVLGAIADAGGTAQAMGAGLLRALCRRCGRSLGRGAGARRSDGDPGFSHDRTDRSRVYGGLHQRRIAGAGRQGGDRPHLRVGLGAGLLGRACEPGAGARADRACAGLGPDRHRPRADCCPNSASICLWSGRNRSVSPWHRPTDPRVRCAQMTALGALRPFITSARPRPSRLGGTDTSGLGPELPSGAEGSQRRSDYRKNLHSV